MFRLQPQVDFFANFLYQQTMNRTLIELVEFKFHALYKVVVLSNLENNTELTTMSNEWLTIIFKFGF